MNRTNIEKRTESTENKQGFAEKATTRTKADGTDGRTRRGLLKVAIDAHADLYVFSVMFEGTAPKPPQKLPLERLLEWLKKHQTQGWEVGRRPPGAPRWPWSSPVECPSDGNSCRHCPQPLSSPEIREVGLAWCRKL